MTLPFLCAVIVCASRTEKCARNKGQLAAPAACMATLLAAPAASLGKRRTEKCARNKSQLAAPAARTLLAAPAAIACMATLLAAPAASGHHVAPAAHMATLLAAPAASLGDKDHLVASGLSHQHGW